jgi:hypothetical protein
LPRTFALFATIARTQLTIRSFSNFRGDYFDFYLDSFYLIKLILGEIEHQSCSFYRSPIALALFVQVPSFGRGGSVSALIYAWFSKRMSENIWLCGLIIQVGLKLTSSALTSHFAFRCWMLIFFAVISGAPYRVSVA